MATVEIDRVTKQYGDFTAVDELSLEIADGEFVSILGPSGCGKSTTLEMLAGLQVPSSGDIRVDGRSVVGVSPRHRGLGLIFQDYSIFPQMSPRANLEFGLRMRRVDSATREREVARVIEIVELDDSTLDKPTDDLTPGELQRVAIGRTLVTRPNIILLDEPLSNLEPDLRARTRAKLKRLFSDLGQTTIYVTHDQVEAMSLSDRVLVMRDGRLQQIGTPEDVYGRSSNTFVGGFIGSPPMNFLAGRLTEDDGRLIAEGPGFSLDLSDRRGEVEPGQGDVVVGIRPEHLERANGDPGPRLEGSVFTVEPLGSETIVDVRVGETIVKMLDAPASTCAVDEPIALAVEADHVHLFDAASERSRLAARGW
jgi:multiple sugar transport system ATP-binding protein